MIERIGRQWPREPDASRFPPEYAEVVRLRRLPFDTEDPFVFHVLTTLSSEADLLQVMRDGGALLPVAMAEERWGDVASMIFARDRIAGDDEYLFTTPCNVFSGYDTRARNNPAVAFRLSYIEQVAEEIAFRVHDLEMLYKEAEQLASGPGDLGMYDDEWDAMSPEEMEERYEEDIAYAVEEQLKAIAELGTQYEDQSAVALTRLYAQLVGAFRTSSMFVDDDEPERIRIYSAARNLFPEALVDTDWAFDLMVGAQAEQLNRDWGHLFGEPGTPLSSFPARLLDAPRGERPELMVQGSLSLCEAAFYRDGQGAWRRVPEEVCVEGREAS